MMLDVTLSHQCYVRLLWDNMLPWATGVFERNFVHVQWAMPRPTQHVTRAFLAQQDVEVMEWPAQNPAMKPVEHVWEQMGVRLRFRFRCFLFNIIVHNIQEAHTV